MKELTLHNKKTKKSFNRVKNFFNVKTSSILATRVYTSCARVVAVLNTNSYPADLLSSLSLSAYRII